MYIKATVWWQNENSVTRSRKISFWQYFQSVSFLLTAIVNPETPLTFSDAVNHIFRDLEADAVLAHVTMCIISIITSPPLPLDVLSTCCTCMSSRIMILGFFIRDQISAMLLSLYPILLWHFCVLQSPLFFVSS